MTPGVGMFGLSTTAGRRCSITKAPLSQRLSWCLCSQMSRTPAGFPLAATPGLAQVAAKHWLHCFGEFEPCSLWPVINAACEVHEARRHLQAVP